MIQQLYRRLLQIAPQEATFARRNFHDNGSGVRQHLEGIGYTFLQGYHAALEEPDLDALAQVLESLPPQGRGFAFEGAAMALTLLDHLSLPRCDRLQRFLYGPAHHHIYMCYVGAGWAWARLPISVRQARRRLDPLLGWLAIDGIGFHAGYFAWRRYIEAQLLPRRLCGYERCVFDQGLGRSLWFVKGADIGQIAPAVAAFPAPRQADLWSGVGLACAYAGGVDRTAVEALRALSEPYLPHLAQGAAFAAKARPCAGISAAHTDMACEILCGLPGEAAAAVTDAALAGLTGKGELPAYAIWRERIRLNFAERRLCA